MMVKSQGIRVGILIGMIVVIAHCVSAEIVTIEVEGVVDDVTITGPYGLDSSVEVGTLMTGYCVYDTDADEINPGLYPLLDISMSIGNYVFGHDSGSSNPARFVVYFDPGYAAESLSPLFEGIVTKDGNPIEWEDQSWPYHTFDLLDVLSSHGEYFTGRELPTVDTFPPFSVFDLRAEFRIGFSDADFKGFGISGYLTDVRAIPEPGSILVMGIGGLVAFRRRRQT